MRLATVPTEIWDVPSSDANQWITEFFDEQSGRSTPAILQTETVADKFARLAAEWRQERPAACSSITDIVTQPAYLNIIGMGEDALPFILTELERELDDWFPALNSIACVNPVATEDRGRMRAMADAWLRWGRLHGHIR